MERAIHIKYIPILHMYIAYKGMRVVACNDCVIISCSINLYCSISVPQPSYVLYVRVYVFLQLR